MYPGDWISSKRDGIQAGDKTEVFHIQRGNIEAKMQGRGSDEKVLESDGDSLGGLFTLNAPGKLSDCQRDRMYDQTMKDVFREDTPTLTVGNSSGPVDSVCQFHCTDC